MKAEQKIYETDPEFMERFEHFAYEEVVKEEGQTLDEKTRYLAILATLLGCQGLDVFKATLPEALDAGLSPVMIKETVYQAVDYLGIGRMYPFLGAVNEVLEERGVQLPFEGQATTTMENRLEKGAALQLEMFGEGMRDAWKKGHINRWLAANCFGDYYTRTRRYPVVIHCTEEVPIWNSSIKEGKVTFMAVSTTTPEKDIIPVATIDRISFRSIFLSSFIFRHLHFLHT